MITESEGHTYRAGALLYQRRWNPAQCRATAVIVHGLGEHSGRYGHVARALATIGVDVLAFDQRGFGRTAGMRGDTRRFQDRLDDLAGTVTSQRRRHPSLPLVLIGHSMGGLIATRYVQSSLPAPDLLVLSGAAIDPRPLERRRAALRLGRAIARALPHLRLPFSNVDALSTDPAVAAATRADPLRVPGLGVRLGLQLAAEQRRAWAELAHISLPVLLLHGADDRMIPSPDARDAAPRLGSADVTLRIYPGMLHEVFNERERSTVLQDLTDWVNQRIP